MLKYLKYLAIYNSTTILKFYKSLQFDLLYKNFNVNFYNQNFVIKVIFTINLTFGLKSETDIRIINSLNVLDFLLHKKASIAYLNNKYLNRSRKIIFINKSIIANKFELFLFFICLKKVIIPALKKKFINFKYKILTNCIISYITDIASISEFSDDLKKDKVNVKLTFFFKNKIEKELIIYFFNFLGLK